MGNGGRSRTRKRMGQPAYGHGGPFFRFYPVSRSLRLSPIAMWEHCRRPILRPFYPISRSLRLSPIARRGALQRTLFMSFLSDIPSTQIKPGSPGGRTAEDPFHVPFIRYPLRSGWARQPGRGSTGGRSVPGWVTLVASNPPASLPLIELAPALLTIFDFSCYGCARFERRPPIF